VKNISKFVPVAVLAAFLLLIIFIPENAFAFDPKKGLTETLDLFKIGLIIVMVASALMAFLRHQLAITIGVIIIGCIIYAATTPGVPEKIGSGILKLFGGE